MKRRLTLTSLLVFGAAAALFAFGEGRHGPGERLPGPPRDSLGGPRRAPVALTPEQKAFDDSQRALRDSMMDAVHVYAKSIRSGSDPRSLVVDRARIQDFATRLERLRTQNLDLWLDVVGLRPMPPRPGRGHPHGQPDDSLRPPPQDEPDVSPEPRP